MWRDGWTAIAEVSGGDSLLHSELEQLLDSNGIVNAIEGSKAYWVFVLNQQVDLATELLREYARASEKDIRFPK
jgi:hypothetical protein